MKKIFFSLVLGVLTLTSCSRDEDLPLPTPAPTGAEKVEKLNASAYDKWVYFSFSTNKIVATKGLNEPISDSWDIAFHRGDVRLNGGESGSGKGEAVKTNVERFEDLRQAPKDGYVKDKKGYITVGAFPNFPTEEHSFNQTLHWLKIDTSNPPPKYTLEKNVFVVKTADGKYVKLKFTDYSNDANKQVYPSFIYQVSNDGKF